MDFLMLLAIVAGPALVAFPIIAFFDPKKRSVL